MAIAGFALFVLGVILIVVSSINRKKNSRCSAQTQGTLMKVSEGDGSNPNAYVYSYSVNGSEYQVRSTIQSKEANNIGDSCTIWYNPSKPKDAQPFHYESDKVYKIILIIGIVMLISGICLPFIGLTLQIR